MVYLDKNIMLKPRLIYVNFKTNIFTFNCQFQIPLFFIYYYLGSPRCLTLLSTVTYRLCTNGTPVYFSVLPLIRQTTSSGAWKLFIGKDKYHHFVI